MTAIMNDDKLQIKEMVCEVLEVDTDEVTETSLFQEDHGADSLLAIEILTNLERTFKIAIDQSELERMVNLEGVYSVVSDAPPA
jgi:acyl carrier protein